MRRRTNKSSKVPNVKLRPAQKGSMPRPTVDGSCWAQETQPGSDDTAPLDLCPRPFKGLAICATGISDKATLFKQAVELGATHTPAFTDRVTHLIADSHGGPKYSCAVARKIPIVKSSWITENYQIWLRGDDVDVQNSVEGHRLPIFSGVVVCPSGIADITRRTEICKLVTAHQGSYVPKLERPVKVTHLLCSGDEETDKMRLAEKFKTRGEADIQLVWEEWFWDSLHYGGRFDEAPYHVRNPRPELRVHVDSATPPPASSEVGSQHDQPISSPARPHQSQHPDNNRRDTNNPEEPEEEPAFVNVLPTVTLQLWSGLLERRGYQVSDGEVILSPSKVEDKAAGKKPAHNLPSSPVRPEVPAGGSVISSFRRANSFAPALHTKEVGPSSRQLPFRRAATSVAAFTSSDAKAGPSRNVGPSNHIPALKGKESAAPGPSKSASVSRIFIGMSFRLLGEAKAHNVRNVIEELGGQISVDQEEEVAFIIVRLLSGSKFYQQEEDESIRKRYRTECWLEHCIYEERVCEVDEQISFTPLSIAIPVDGAEDITMSLSGFEQSESCGMKRLLRALGIKLAPTFTRRSTLLLCRSGTGLKFEKAQEWGVPVVGLGWLRAMAQTGNIPNPSDYIVEAIRVSDAVGACTNDAVEKKENDCEAVKRRVMHKGKGKATAADMDAMDVDKDGKANGIMNDHVPKSSQQHTLPKACSTKGSLEHQDTVIIPSPQTSRQHSTFGPPNETLGGRGLSSLMEEQRRYSSLPQTAPGSPNSMLPFENGVKTRKETMTLSVGQIADSVPISGPEQRQPTQTVFDPNDNISGRVPSSMSPSPMRAPSLQKSCSSRNSASPVKIDHEATKALQESIASLLGKRPSPDGDESSIDTGTRGQRARTGKRARPQRLKPQTRNMSDAQNAGPSKLNPTRPQTRASKAAMALPLNIVTDIDLSLNPFGPFPEELNLPDDGESQQESVRITYEDPGQRDEKRRLMNLLKEKASNLSGHGESETLSMSGGLRCSDRVTRRSTRIAG